MTSGTLAGSIRVGSVVVVAVLVVMMMVLVSAAPAFAEMPVWTITSATAPSSIAPGAEGELVVKAIDLGDAAAQGSTSQIMLSDTVPAGLTVTEVTGHSAGGREFRQMTCTVSPVECMFNEALVPYEPLEMHVHVTAGNSPAALVNRVSVVGGGARGASGSGAVTISATPKSFGVEEFTMAATDEDGSEDTQAGSHPFQFTTTLRLNTKAAPEGSGAVPTALAKDLHFDLPAGVIGNPTVVPQCTDRQFSSLEQYGPNQCPNDTVIGVSSVSFITPERNEEVTAVVPLFNLVPSVGEPAKFGFEVFGTPVILDTSLRTGGDYGVVVSVNDISQVFGFISSQTTFWGVPADPRHNNSRGWTCVGHGIGRGVCGEFGPQPGQLAAPFLTLPTSCTGPPHTTVEADSWAEPGTFRLGEYTFQDLEKDPVGMDGCNRLDFEPSMSVVPDGRAASTPTGLTIGLHVPQEATLNPTGLAEADVKSTTVALPEGIALNPAAADGLEACSTEQVGFKTVDEQTQTALFTPAAAACPEASKIGTVEINTPLLPNPLTGAVYLAAQDQNPFGSLVAMYLVAEDPVSGVLVKLAGEVKPDPVTGGLVSTFANTPQLPFEDLHLKFFGTARAPLNTPALCGTYTTVASMEPWSENLTARPSSNFEITTGPDGSPCADPLPFSPSLTGGTTSIQAGGFSPFTMTMSREDGQQALQGIQLRMPPGVSGLLSGVKLCQEAQADAGTCGPESEIGETIVSVGLGGDPFSVKGGKVFITGPYKGAPFGLSIVNPAKAGPFNLGYVVVRAKIEVNPETAALTITTDNEGPYKIPTIIDGIPLQIKHVNVDINRPGFTFNATNCSPLKITGSLVSTEGSSSALSVPYQVTNCAVLAFKPKLEASTSGKSSRLDGTSLNVKLSYPAGPYDANIAKVKVELPEGLPSRLPTLQKACLSSVFEANPAACPAASVIGHATATTPVLPVPLSGPAYFVSHGGEAFPSLIIVLQGYGVTVHLVGTTFISKQGITSSTFKTVPDVPVGSFELNLPAGRYSALTALGNLCKDKSLSMPTEFVGQNGALVDTDTKVTVTGCGKSEKVSHKHKKHRGKGGGRKAGRGERRR
jgi:hypothetical protein